ncbi:MAG: hypothetical protein RL733_1392, partial [Actinomycetota bacterium]
EFIYTMKKARKAHGDKVILDDVTLMFYPGAKIGVVGPNGAGKSTVLQIMAGLQQPSNGEAYLTPGYTVGILMQEPILNEEKNVIDNVKEGVAEQKQDVALKVAEEVVVKINDQVKVLNDALNQAEKVGFAVPEKITTVAVVQIPKVTPAVATPSVITEVKTTVIAELTKTEEKLVNALPKGNDVVIKTKTLIKKFTKLFPKGVKIAFATLSSSLTKGSIAQLKKLATIPFKKITVTGYVQKSKNRKNDKSLSKSRADAVAKVLIKAGIKKKLIATIAGGVGGKSKKSRSAVIIIA